MESSSQKAPSGDGWRKASANDSLSEAFRSVDIPTRPGFWRKLFAFSGPGFLVAVGYMDPGNWATGLAGGSAFGYTLLSVILISNLMAILLQALCARLGIVTGRDLAQACRDHYSRPVSIILWILCEVAICACDLAEVIGSAIALNLLFGLPLVVGVVVTVLDVFVMLFLQNKGFRYIEALVLTLILTIAGCFALELILAKPEWSAVLGGFIPTASVVTNSDMLYLALGILGATVMPHNLYLHSSLVQTRKFERTPQGRREAVRFAMIDSTGALMFALFINAAILILAAAAFHTAGHTTVAELPEAHRLLSPVLGTTLASTLFAVALLASGQNATLTGTLAGQIVMEGFIDLKMKPWVRRLLTRGVAVVPAAIVAVMAGSSGLAKLLVLSQVVLSLQLSFAVVPLVVFTGDRSKMGDFANPAWLKIAAWAVTAVIVGLNIKYLFDFFGIAG